jgi:hypothetical protein
MVDHENQLSRIPYFTSVHPYSFQLALDRNSEHFVIFPVIIKHNQTEKMNVYCIQVHFTEETWNTTGLINDQSDLISFKNMHQCRSLVGLNMKLMTEHNLI